MTELGKAVSSGKRLSHQERGLCLCVCGMTMWWFSTVKCYAKAGLSVFVLAASKLVISDTSVIASLCFGRGMVVHMGLSANERHEVGVFCRCELH